MKLGDGARLYGAGKGPGELQLVVLDCDSALCAREGHIQLARWCECVRLHAVRPRGKLFFTRTSYTDAAASTVELIDVVAAARSKR